MYNFSVPAIPANLRFYFAHCTALDLFGQVSLGIARDAFRLAYMPCLRVEASPRFVASVDDAAAYFAGLLRAEITPERLADLRRFFERCPDEFAPHEITTPSDPRVGEVCFALAFDYATGSRGDAGGGGDAERFMVAMWEVFAEEFFAAETADSVAA